MEDPEGEFRVTIVLKKTFDVFKKTLDVLKKTTVCFFRPPFYSNRLHYFKKSTNESGK